ncbi:chemotaxis protein CheB [Tautonia plasticadhaerens]|uniref:histidine kinase n=1 Tax=Tautonia plasticadhaerens TaxID=2527974 RepID=A0A518GUB3_9BACT|nr:chemotaxis protein CheB [Tautonia plasticadhaerens]QDV32179.1 Virulence sensor protein BvgS precursor [Tautonia plasticadhaerens]
MSPVEPEEPLEPATGDDPRAPGEPGETRAPFPVVGIGASAGGLEAFRRLLSRIPADPGMAIVLVQHLDPHAESNLPDILATVSKMPVVWAVDGMPITPNRVHVNPPNMTLEVVWGKLRLTPRPHDKRPFMPIDYMMRSLAQDVGSRAVGVILTGGGTDGTLGLRSIKDADGITFVQDTETATHDAMPRSAIASGAVDEVLPPEGIADELARIGRSSYMNGGDPGEKAPEPGGDLGEAELGRIFGLMRASTGVDFSRYKRSTILRRVRRRMALRRVDRTEEYLWSLQADENELTALYQDFLIRVTSFFRDPEVFESLRRDIFPQLLQDRAPEAPIRIWVAGCSTGEEVYSLAITLLEALGDRAHATPIKILATDVNDRALEIARAGSYVENVAMDIAPDLLRRHFIRTDGSFQISKAIRDLCVFSRHDVTRDPPFARLDVVSCRNLLIYLDLAAQKRILPLFHYGLKPDGYLMLGPSETIGGFGELFAPVSPEHKIFSRKATVARPHPLFERMEPPDEEGQPRRRIPLYPAPDPVLLDVQREADRAVLARFSPPGVLVDEDLHILQFRGRTDPYLAQAPGSPNLGLLKMAREGLLVELRVAIGQARVEDASVRRPAVRLERDGRAFPIEIIVVPLRQEGIKGRFFLVLFEEHPRLPARLSSSHQLSPQTEAETGGLAVEEARLQVIALRRELDATREYLQAVVEENEATTEELKSANEEILSSNEELQSTNEELQTAKEEMQSTNEELQTVNDELNHRNAELARINDDLVNLFGSVNIAIVMVSRDLKIRRFTTPAEKVLNLMGHDIGRPIDHIRPNVEVPDLGRHLAEVISSLAPRDLEVQDREGRWYSFRLRPYITVENKIDGAVLAIVDIDEIKRSTLKVRRALDYAEAIVESVRQPLLVLDEGLVVRRVNQAFCRTFRLSSGEVVGRPMAKLGGAWADPELTEALRPVLAEGRPVKGRELTADFPIIGHRTFQYGGGLIDWKGAGTPMILLAMDDITDRKREAERDRMLMRELSARIEAEQANRKKDEFLAMLAHELRNPLSPVLNALLVLRSPGASPGDLEWATQIMERQVRHMARLIDDLLDVSRVMRGSIQLRTERIDLGRVARQVVENVRSFVRSRRHELTVSIPEQPIPMFADPVRVEQILTNLLHNAAKYTPEAGKISLTIDRGEGEAVVRVKDNGIGIDPDQLGEVFELFMQADKSLDRSLGGLGIGLTLVKTLVELHGGSIQGFSEGPGLGSEFVVRLPEAADAVEGPRVEEDGEPTPPRRILIVDDSPDALRTMEVLLHRLGHDIRTAPDGPSALAAVAEFGPDLVLLDLGLPGLDGYQVARRLRDGPPTAGLTLVALSGYGQEEDLRRCREAGFDDHAVKPIDLDRLQQLLHVRRG